MMPEYIERDSFLAEQRHLYCDNCERRKGMKNGKIRFCYEIGDAPCRACGIADVLDNIEDFPAADVVEVVRCRDCIYWQKPQVWQNDGTFRDYEPGEYERGSIFCGVSLEVGVNYGSFCALYNQNHENQIPQFMGENDFCSKGYKREES